MPACLREIFLFFRMEIPAYQSVCVVFVCVFFMKRKNFCFRSFSYSYLLYFCTLNFECLFAVRKDKNRCMKMCREKRGYVAPAVQLHRFVMEAGFAVSLFGDSDGIGKTQISNPNSDQIGQYQDGVNWTNDTWN